MAEVIVAIHERLPVIRREDHRRLVARLRQKAGNLRVGIGDLSVVPGDVIQRVLAESAAGGLEALVVGNQFRVRDRLVLAHAEFLGESLGRIVLAVRIEQVHEKEIG